MSTYAYWPMLVLIAWTAFVGYMAVKRRVREIRKKQIALQSIATQREMAGVLEDNQAVDNFNNLLQVPILFYVWCLSITQLSTGGWLLGIFAWFYVGARVWHSVIQVTHNNVLRRFRVWMLSNVILILLWGVFAIQLLWIA